MKIPTGTWLSVVVIVFLAGLLLNSADLILVALLGGTVALGARSVGALRDHLEGRRFLTEGEAPVQEVERRLHPAEQAPLSASEEGRETG